MSTSTPTNGSQETLKALVSTGQVLVVGLGWAAVMLFVLGSWMQAKYIDGSRYRTYIFVIAGAAAAALAVWQAFTLWFQKATPEEKTVTLTQQRRLYSLIFLAAGLGLVGLAFVLGLGRKTGGGYGFLLDNLGESIGVLLFGLIALGAGYSLSLTPTLAGGSADKLLVGMVPFLKILLVVFAVAAFAGTLFIFVYAHRHERSYIDWLAESSALGWLSILALACFIWINMTKVDEFGARLAVFVFGGGLGLIVFLYSLGKIAYWRNDIVFGGISAWQGENAWHFWMCVYLQLAALILMFGSFNLARTDIRNNVTLRRVMYGYDTLVQGLLLLEMLIVFNIVFYVVVPYTYDWTQSRGLYPVSDAGKTLIGNLKKEVNVVVVMGQNDPVYRDLHNLLDNAAALSPKLKVQYLSPDSDQVQYARLEKQFKVLGTDSPLGGGAGGRGVLIVNGPMPAPDDDEAKSPHAFLAASKFTEDDFAEMRKPGGKAKKIFKGEGEILKELSFLVQGKKRKVYILQGNDEPDINGDDMWLRPSFQVDLYKAGLQVFVEKLNKDNYEVFGLNFGKELPGLKEPPIKVEYVKEEADKKKHVPKDCDTLIVLPTSKPLPADAVDAIERYMESRKGKMMVLLDVIANDDWSKLRNTGLEPLLKRFGVDVPDSYPIAVRNGQIPPSVLVVTAASKSEHVLAKKFVGRSIAMRNLARIVKADAKGAFKAEPVLEVLHRQGNFAMVETDVRVLKQDLDLYLEKLDRTRQLGARISQTPVTVAVAVSESGVGKGDDDRPRMVVIGDTEFLSNVDLLRGKSLVNYSFAVSSLEWLAERQNIGVQPRESLMFSIDPSVDFTRMVWLPGWIMLLILIGLGIGIWVVRRR